VVWKHLAHPNIVPLLGVTIDPLQLISDRMPGGNLTEYIANNPEADRLRLVNVFLLSCTGHSLPRQLSDVAEGLNYLHSCNVIHGDLKGVRSYSMSLFAATLTPIQSNVLVDAAGHSRITDFGLAVVTHTLDSIQTASGEYVHDARWTAPEILDGRGTYTKEADVFSFAMVTIEVRRGWFLDIEVSRLTII